MSSHRTDADRIDSHPNAPKVQRPRGKFKVFFGAAAGVGKTSAMLDAARQDMAQGRDVIVGFVDTHGRAEMLALVAGFEMLAPRVIYYHGTPMREFDLDGALARRPQLILLDELAHTNAPGSRHPKRWQDSQELLAAGIDVYTTLDVQHLESMNDVVARITGIAIGETVPDSVLDQADDVELIDLTADELIQRVKLGKVHVPQMAEHVQRRFFRRGNLMALRELALRRTAERVDDQVQAYRRQQDIGATWPVAERIIVGIHPGPTAEHLVRAGKRMAAALNAEWMAVHVETPEQALLSQTGRDQLAHAFRLAEQLGAETTTLSGNNVSEELLEYAHARNVTKVVVGKPTRAPWRQVLFGSVVQELVHKSGDIDIYVIAGDRDESQPVRAVRTARPSDRSGYVWAATAVALCTAFDAALMSLVSPTTLVMVYLLAVTMIASRHGPGPSTLASVLSVLAFDFFLVPPYHTFAVSDTQYVVVFAIMLVVALTISTLTARIAWQAEAARSRERRTAALYSMSRALASTASTQELVEVAIEHIGKVTECRVAILLPDASGQLVPADAAFPMAESELAVAEWSFTHAQMAGLGTETLPGSHAIYLPLTGTRGTTGVLGVLPANASYLTSPEQVRLLEALGNQTALAIERARLAEESQEARLQIETERTRNALLSSISHDLKTPLAAITGAATSLMDDTAGECRDLAQMISEEAERLNRLIGNLLDMTRLEAGAVKVRKEWHALEEVVGAVLSRLDDRLQARPVIIQIPADLPLVPFDSVLIDQVLVNLLENAIKYTPSGSPIEISARIADNRLLVLVADSGPGIRPGDEERIFDKFYRARPNGGGVGLGLTISRGVLNAHGGTIRAQNRETGGAVFEFALPLGGQPPEIEPEANELEDHHVRE